MDQDLPPDWKSAVDPNTKRTYYYHVKTKAVSWDKPKKEESPAQEHTKKEIIEEEQPKLPPGWEVKFDEKTKRKYYVNKALQKSTWKFPTEDSGTKTSKKSSSTTSSPRQTHSAHPERESTPTTPVHSSTPSKSSTPTVLTTTDQENNTVQLAEQISSSSSNSNSVSDAQHTQPIEDTKSTNIQSPAVLSPTALPAQHHVSYETSLPGTVSLIPTALPSEQRGSTDSDRSMSMGGYNTLPTPQRARHSVPPAVGNGAQTLRVGMTSSSLLASGGGVTGAPLRMLPPNLKAEIHSFKIEGFAKEHFARHQTGFLFLKKAIPIDELMAFQKDTLSKPLLRDVKRNKNIAKDALKNFEDILMYTGLKQGKEKSNSQSNHSTSSSVPVVTLGMKMAAQRIVGRGTSTPELRDEIFLQLCKQTNPTPALRRVLQGKREEGKEKEKEEKEKEREKRLKEEREQMDAIERGWQLMILCCDSFSPTRDLEKTLLSHLDKAMENGDDLGGDEKSKQAEAAAAAEADAEQQAQSSSTSPSSSSADKGAKKMFEKGREEELTNHLTKVSVLAQYALNRLQNTTLFGGEGKGRGRDKVSDERVSELTDITSTKRVFSCSLNEILLRQQTQHFVYSAPPPSSSSSSSSLSASASASLKPSSSPSSSEAIRVLTPEERDEILSAISVKSEADIPVPIVCVYLAIRLMSVNGLQCEGVFRKCITIDETEQSVNQINKGLYTLQSQNPHLYAVLLKTWLKRLTDPLIPFTLYQSALSVASEQAACVNFVETAIPETNRILLKYLCRFLRVIANPANVDANRMNGSNLALIFAPTLIRMDTDNPAQAVKNLKMEIQFVFNLILALFPTPEEEKLFADADTFVCARCGEQLTPGILALFGADGK
ncbi:putative rho GTPase-activating protein 39 [Monocercomonoides exilis]|uniref:putative rho GTPase-activating protein 39 n=1 Tax=Monocercomonoides exilis TaxID=2049356 RepID=UPI00355A4DC2|nr:putative rho GTPase-activating protein 39 [Monocercomonoides exilis]|eukprot:MONOS_4724.1-p1 / transcript=MONOS_4724.1 / gene=MONOS_4724 / organism=Monocercomonoides_exilis_PA203 / gene_product=uncharacterized protein LOC492329 / transcript_product=uncharacterized protein LOC492329 / location=Mono_scaffold00129:41609-44450(+) / protein_length=885 / sequence_SO=supercontig / SO=protein_coding / is_pseudo=false